MSLQTASILYLRNSTTVDTGTGIDVRFLDSVNAGVADETQTFTFTHTQDNIDRTFDPATAAAATNTNNAATTLFKAGWALRLTQDMTPVDDTNCNAYLSAGTATVKLYLRSAQTGGTYVSGNFAPTVKASLWRYNPSTDTGTLIASGTASATWAVTGGTNNTFQQISVPITIASGVEFSPGEILYLQAGMNSNTIPNPTLGTATFTITLRIDSGDSGLYWDTAADQYISQVCYFHGSSSGVGAATGSGVPVFPTAGTASGSGAASGAFMAFVSTVGTTTGTGTASGTFGAVKLGAGSASGTGTASGDPALVQPTVGTVEVAGGGTTIVKKNIFLMSD